ncbi:MAG: hypothetical protein NTX25_21765 [Proteobacteria bacterium]|nr:hypothetical protein [Pseudomonadota bacterium]
MDYLKTLLRPQEPFLRSLVLGSHQFPGVWVAMFPPELQRMQFPEERRSTCSKCPKSCYDNYRADYRCCTYLPQVSNFLLGFATETPAGDQAFQRLKSRGALLPEGMHYTPQQWIDFLDDEHQDAFGRSNKVLCPLLDQSTGYCNIHSFRNAVCSTYFCYNDHGGAGESFWEQLQTLGSTLEKALAQWSLKAVGFDLNQYFKIFDGLANNIQNVSKESGWRDEALAQLWGSWYGQERALYRACAAVILEQRDQLWTIAQSQIIRESDAFDRAMVSSVPSYLQPEIDKEEMGEDLGEILSPDEIWQGCLNAYQNLWAWPDAPLTLSNKLCFVQNQRQTAEDLHYADKDFFIEYRYHKDSEQPVWRLGVSTEEKNVLELFDKKKIWLDADFLQGSLVRGLPHGQSFLSEMIHRKVLWPMFKSLEQDLVQ